jgi:Ca2+-binding EF-hand superfamily protein
MKRKTSLFAAICVTSFVSGAAMAGGEKLQFSVNDQDGNGAVSQAELVSVLEDAALFDRLDQNDNSRLEEAEADNDLIEYDEEIDTDKGGTIDRNEFAMAIFTKFDDDDNNRLDEGEFADFSEQASEMLDS